MESETNPNAAPSELRCSTIREQFASRQQLRKDIYDEVYDAIRMTYHQGDSVESQSERVTKKIMMHVQAWALMDKVTSEETRNEIRALLESERAANA